jgi:hypothetical protein
MPPGHSQYERVILRVACQWMASGKAVAYWKFGVAFIHRTKVY